jgi:hypothetical protein
MEVFPERVGSMDFLVLLQTAQTDAFEDLMGYHLPEL